MSPAPSKTAPKKPAAAKPKVITKASISAMLERANDGPLLDSPGGFVLAVMNEKGGVGKTTMSTHLAWMCAAIGWDTLLMDVDIQGSATKWANVRNDYGLQPMIPCVGRTGKVGNDIAAMAARFDVVIVDSGGRDSLEMRQAIGAADVMLLPVQAGQYDIWSLGTMDTAVMDVEQRTGEELSAGIAFLNMAQSAPTSTLNSETMDAMKGLQRFRAIDQMVVDRAAFAHAATRGSTIFELDRIDAKACEEMCGVFKEVFGNDYPI